jgi:hypothetical protein
MLIAMRRDPTPAIPELKRDSPANTAGSPCHDGNIPERSQKPFVSDQGWGTSRDFLHCWQVIGFATNRDILCLGTIRLFNPLALSGADFDKRFHTGSRSQQF